MRGQRRIEQVYAFVCMDDDNTEGIPAFKVQALGPRALALPLIAADWKRVEQLKPIARQMAQDTGKKITLCRFEIRTELESYEGKD